MFWNGQIECQKCMALYGKMFERSASGDFAMWSFTSFFRIAWKCWPSCTAPVTHPHGNLGFRSGVTNHFLVQQVQKPVAGRGDPRPATEVDYGMNTNVVLSGPALPRFQSILAEAFWALM